MVSRRKYKREKIKRKMLEKENRKLKQKIISHPGSLNKMGFTEKESLPREKRAIRKADKQYGVKDTDLKLAALETFNRHRERIRDKIQELIKWNEDE